MSKINRTTVKLVFIFFFFIVIQMPPVFLGLKLACDGSFFSHVIASEQKLKILNLQDKLITYSDRLLLEGFAENASRVEVNNQIINIDSQGNFKVGLVLKNGKNVVTVKGSWGSYEEQYQFRILKLISFSDIEKLFKGKAHWAQKTIKSLATLGIVEGYPDNNFDPKKDVSRGEFATWVVKAKNHSVEKPTKDPFIDVPKEHWRAPYIKESFNRGYMKGKPDGSFGIEDPVTRAEAALIIKKAEGLNLFSVSKSSFEDVSKNIKEYEAIHQVFIAGLMVGVSNVKKIFQPNRFLSRAEAVTLLSRLDSVKERVSYLFNFGYGYNNSRICLLNTAPVIKLAEASPGEIIPDGKSPVLLLVKVEEKQGLSDISQVKIDLREIGGPPDAIMYDDGTNGDEKENDGTYTLRVLVYDDAEKGLKRLRAVVKDRGGWEAGAWIELFINKAW